MKTNTANIVNILGTVYGIYYLSEEEDEKLKNVDGYTDFSTKDIVIDVTETDNVMRIADIESYRKKVLRHEIIHAFMYESGLDCNASWSLLDTDNGQPEQIVDWIAIQFSKILKVFNELDLL